MQHRISLRPLVAAAVFVVSLAFPAVAGAFSRCPLQRTSPPPGRKSTIWSRSENWNRPPKKWRFCWRPRGPRATRKAGRGPSSRPCSCAGRSARWRSESAFWRSSPGPRRRSAGPFGGPLRCGSAVRLDSRAIW